MGGRIRRSVQAALDGTPEMARAAGDLHHLAIGPGEALEAEWLADGLELPDLPAMRQYRVDRTVETMKRYGCDGVFVMDPMNIRYVSDTTNMQLWVMHNAARYAFVSGDGDVVVWDYEGCEFLSGHSHVVTEARPAIGSTYFLAGNRYEEITQRWAADVLDVIADYCGPNARIAVDQCSYLGFKALEGGGISIANGQEVMEEARKIKGPDEIRAMRCSAHACQAAMADMRERMQPGMTEREIWAQLHEGNIARGGEWIETQILASGPRTNPWFQEASARVVENGDIVAYDTDLVGAYGMMIDISRTWVCGDKAPTAHQQRLFDMADEMVKSNAEMLTPGRSFRELTLDSTMPPREHYRHYSVKFHGVGQCDEYPDIYHPWAWEEWGLDDHLEVGMVLTSESYIGSRDGGEGVKLEDQYLVTENGPELLTDFPVSLTD